MLESHEENECSLTVTSESNSTVECSVHEDDLPPPPEPQIHALLHSPVIVNDTVSEETLKKEEVESKIEEDSDSKKSVSMRKLRYHL